MYLLNKTTIDRIGCIALPNLTETNEWLYMYIFRDARSAEALFHCISFLALPILFTLWQYLHDSSVICSQPFVCLYLCIYFVPDYISILMGCMKVITEKKKESK